MRNKLILFAMFLSCFFYMHSQEKVVINQDTLITITPKNLSTINGIIEEFEWTKVENSTLREIIKTDSIRICLKDSILVQQELREKKKEEFYVDQANNLVKEKTSLEEKNKKLKKKATIFTGVGGILGLIIGILIML